MEYVLDTYYSGVRDLDEFIAWIMRSWFDKEKYAKSRWFSEHVTSDNVLINIVENPNFPCSPAQLMEIWHYMPAIKVSLCSSSSNEDISAIETALGSKSTGGIYKKGEETLSAIGAEIGDISATMIKKLGDGAEEKIKKFYGYQSPFSLSEEKEEEIIELVENARVDAAVEYAQLVKNSTDGDGNFDAKLFFEKLVKAQILSFKEIELISADEIQGLFMLFSMDEDIMEEVLMEDIEYSDNTFKTYQNAVSRKVFPAGRRGRPRKTQTEEI